MAAQPVSVGPWAAEAGPSEEGALRVQVLRALVALEELAARAAWGDASAARTAAARTAAAEELVPRLLLLEEGSSGAEGIAWARPLCVRALVAADAALGLLGCQDLWQPALGSPATPQAGEAAIMPGAPQTVGDLSTHVQRLCRGRCGPVAVALQSRAHAALVAALGSDHPETQRAAALLTRCGQPEPPDDGDAVAADGLLVEESSGRLFVVLSAGQDVRAAIARLPAGGCLLLGPGQAQPLLSLEQADRLCC